MMITIGRMCQCQTNTKENLNKARKLWWGDQAQYDGVLPP